jgi:glycosyltransferase involved in cell wall biosynthesis
MKSINYSIIIPHKNIPQLLQRCLDSIPRREDVQIIVVDDNSDTDKVDFANFPGLNDPYVEVVFGKNESGRKGPGYARNLGLERAKGKWLVFADADDFFNNPAFEEALDKYANSDADMICFASNAVDSDDTSIKLEDRPFAMGNIIKLAKEKNDLDIVRYRTGTVCWRFIKNDLIKKTKLKFQEIFYREDNFFAVQIGYNANQIILDDELAIYCYTYRKGSLTTKFQTQTGIINNFTVCKTIMKYLKKRNKKIDFYNTDFIYAWNDLLKISLMRYIVNFPTVFCLSYTRKTVVKSLLRNLRKKL